MSRRQLILFLSLVTLSIIFLFLTEHAKLVLATKLSSVLLFPVKITTEFFDFLSVSRTRTEELEITINQLRLENAELKKKVLQDTTEFQETKFTLLKAQIIGRDPSNINGFLHIDKGEQQNVYVNQPVITTSGLVGKIKFVNAHYSIAETVENQRFAISGLHEKTGVHGIVKQRGNLVFDYVRITDEINIGDSIYTSGMSEIFPKGILIGTVQKIQQIDDLFFKPVYLTPSVQVNRLTSVYLIVGKGTEKKVELNQSSE